MAYLTAGCLGLLFVVFLVAAAGKLRSRAAYAEFRGSLVRMGLVAPRRSRAVALAVVGAEAVTALVLGATMALPTQPALKPGFALAGLQLAAFTGAVAVVIRRGSTEPCRCFGASRRPPGRLHLARNLLLLMAAGAGLAAAMSAGLPSDRVWNVFGAAAGGIVALPLIYLEEIVDLFGSA